MSGWLLANVWILTFLAGAWFIVGTFVLVLDWRDTFDLDLEGLAYCALAGWIIWPMVLMTWAAKRLGRKLGRGKQLVLWTKRAARS